MVGETNRVELPLSEDDFGPNRKQLYPETKIKVVVITPQILGEMKDYLVADRKAWNAVGKFVVDQIAKDSEFLEKVESMTKIKRKDLLRVI